MGSQGTEHPCSWEPPRGRSCLPWGFPPAWTPARDDRLFRRLKSRRRVGFDEHRGGSGRRTPHVWPLPPPVIAPFCPCRGIGIATPAALAAASIPPQKEVPAAHGEGTVVRVPPRPDYSWVYLLHDRKLFSRPLCHSASRHSQDVGTEPYFIFYICKSHFILYLYRAKKKYLFIF